MRHQNLAQHSGGKIAGLERRVAKMDATLETCLEGPFAPASRVNLGLHDDSASTHFGRDLFGLLRGEGDTTGLGGDSKLGEKFPGLVFVDIHLATRGGWYLAG